MKKIPLRTCIISKEKLPKNELVRVVRTPVGTIIIDITGKANGRGAYLKKDEEVIKKACKSKALEKHLETIIPENIFEELTKLVRNER